MMPGWVQPKRIEWGAEGRITKSGCEGWVGCDTGRRDYAGEQGREDEMARLKREKTKGYLFTEGEKACGAVKDQLMEQPDIIYSSRLYRT